MLKVYIVDDEEWTRISIRESIDWASLGMAICGEARNGQLAIDTFRLSPPDIVITDIRMPVMDGIRLLETIDREFPDMLVILLSGYAEFEYAKKAIGHRAFGYLLKPIDEDQLRDTMSKAAVKLLEAGARRDEVNRMNMQLNEIGTIPREKFLTNLVTGAAGGIREIRFAMTKHGVRADWPLLAVSVLKADNFQAISESRYGNDADLTGFVFLNIVSEFFQKEAGWIVFRLYGKNDLIVCMKGSESEDEHDLAKSIRSKLNEVADTLNRTIGIHTKAGIGEAISLLSDAHHSYKQAMEALRNVGFLGDGPILDAMEVSSRNENYVFPEDKEKALLYYLENGYTTQVEVWVDDLFLDWASNVTAHPDGIRQTFLELLVGIRKLLAKYHFHLEELLEERNLPDLIWQRLGSPHEMRTWLRESLRTVAGALVERRKHGSRKAIVDILGFLQAHYAEEITLYSVAEAFYMNPAYLSRLFKQESGRTFNEYLSEIRMNAAANLLESDEELKIGDISMLAGYENVSYFMKKFKEHYGLTPSEYRNKAFGEKEKMSKKYSE